MTDRLSVPERSRLMARIRSRDTLPELRVRSRLHALGFRFRTCRKDLPGTPDIVLSRYRTVILVHGCLWHGHSLCAARGSPKSNMTYWRGKVRENRARDRKKAGELRGLGWRIITIWECETLRDEAIDGKIAMLLSKRACEEIRGAAIAAIAFIGPGLLAILAAKVARLRGWFRRGHRRWLKKS